MNELHGSPRTWKTRGFISSDFPASSSTVHIQEKSFLHSSPRGAGGQQRAVDSGAGARWIAGSAAPSVLFFTPQRGRSFCLLLLGETPGQSQGCFLVSTRTGAGAPVLSHGMESAPPWQGPSTPPWGRDSCRCGPLCVATGLEWQRDFLPPPGFEPLTLPSTGR